MSIESQVADLVTATTNLTTAVNASKATLDQKVADATTQAGLATTNGAVQVALAATQAANAAGSAASANTSASSASGSAAQALAIYGTTTAMNSSLTTAAAQSRFAQTAVASASSILQQDLSAVNNAALHRSPNTVVATFLYDTQKDSDGGAWVERMQDKSWFNEPLNGAWIPGGFATELMARGDNLIANAETPFIAAGWYNAGGTPVNTTVSGPTPAIPLAVNTTGGNRGLALGNLVGVYQISAWVNGTGSIYIRRASGTYATMGGSLTGNGAWQYLTTTAVLDSTTGYEIFSSGTVSVTALKLNQVGVLPSTYSASPELVSNGGFDNGVVGWSQYVGTISNASGLLRYTYGTSNFGTVAQAVTTVVGKVYSVGFDVVANGGGSVSLIVGSDQYGNSPLLTQSLATGVIGRLSGTFVATATTSWIVAKPQSGAINVTIVDMDNFSVKEVTTLATAYVPYSTQTNSYYQSSADGKFYKLGAGYGALTEVFRGNKAKFPRLAAIVAEGANVTIYDLTEPGRPMWLRIQKNGPQISGLLDLLGLHSNGERVVSTVAMLNGVLAVGSNMPGFTPSSGTGDYGLSLANFPSDKGLLYRGGFTRAFNGNLAQRNSLLGSTLLAGAGVIAHSWINAVAMAVLPDAPIDPVTGLQVPTIAVATAGGVSVIKQDGSVASEAINADGGNVTVVNVSLDSKGNLYIAHGSGNNRIYVKQSPYLASAALAFDMRASSVPALLPTPSSNLTSTSARLLSKGMLASRANASGVSLVRENQATTTASAVAYIAPTYNTGYMAGDTRRTLLADTVVGNITGAELVTNGTFDADTAGWTSGLNTPALSVGAGAMRITQAANGASIGYQAITCIIGKTYTATMQFVSKALTGTMCFNVGSSAANAGFGQVQSNSVGVFNIQFLATQATIYIAATSTASALTGEYFEVDNISVKEVEVDRSAKAKPANIYGTLNKALTATGNQLVGYSGFSAANYLQESYSADLDFGTGEWSVGGWFNSLYGCDAANLVAFPEQFDNAVWVKTGLTVTPNTTATTAPDGTSTADKLVEDTSAGQHLLRQDLANAGLTATGSVYVKAAERTFCSVYLSANSTRATLRVNLSTGVITQQTTALAVINSSSITAVGGGWYRVAICATASTFAIGALVVSTEQDSVLDGNSADVYTGDGVSGIYVWGAKMNQGTTPGAYTPGQTAVYNPFAPIIERNFSSGPRLNFGIDGVGKLTATAFDGTTTRTVTTTNAYNTGIYTKATATYKAGKLAILVNGLEVASANGAPLLTLNNSAAVLTIGNNYLGNAPFPGSITLAKVGATVASAEQEVWMYEQEKQMFRDNAQITLPAATTVTDLAYDEDLDKFVVLQAGFESNFTGLVRTMATAPSAGTYSKVSAGAGGVELLSRITTSPGVDVTIPAYGLREEMLRKVERNAKQNKPPITFDFDAASFSATTTSGSNQLTAVAGLVGAVFIGMGITGAGIPAATTVIGINGTTYMISANATATGTVVAMGQNTFTLPAGYTTKEVLSAGASQREGATKNFVRLYDGFKETIRFAVAPASAAWVQIIAVKE